MVQANPFRLVLFLVAALLLFAGPGSPLCDLAMATPVEAAAMKGCAMPHPAEPDASPVHPDCASVCVGTVCPAPIILPDAPIEKLPRDTAMPRLGGLNPVPEPEPPRSMM